MIFKINVVSIFSVPGGLTIREGITIIEDIFEMGRFKCIDICEVNPEIGSLTDTKKTVDSAIYLLKAACGTHRRGNFPVQMKDLPTPE